MGTKINSLIMQNRLLSQAKSRARATDAAVGKALMKNAKSSDRDSGVNTLAQKAQDGSLSGDLKKRDDYSTMKKLAQNLREQTNRFLFGSDEEWETLSEEEKTAYEEEIRKELPEFLKDYNRLLGYLSNGDNASKIFYKQFMGYFDKAEKEMEKLGIQQKKDGTLSLDEKLLAEVEGERLRNLLSRKDSFMGDINKRIENIISNADTNLSVINNSLFSGNYSYNRYGSDIYNLFDGLGGYDAKS